MVQSVLGSLQGTAEQSREVRKVENGSRKAVERSSLQILQCSSLLVSIWICPPPSRQHFCSLKRNTTFSLLPRCLFGRLCLAHHVTECKLLVLPYEDSSILTSMFGFKSSLLEEVLTPSNFFQETAQLYPSFYLKSQFG